MSAAPIYFFAVPNIWSQLRHWVGEWLSEVVYSDVVCIENKRVICMVTLYRLQHSTKPNTTPNISLTHIFLSLWFQISGWKRIYWDLKPIN